MRSSSRICAKGQTDFDRSKKTLIYCLLARQGESQLFGLVFPLLTALNHATQRSQHREGAHAVRKAVGPGAKHESTGTKRTRCAVRSARPTSAGNAAQCRELSETNRLLAPLVVMAPFRGSKLEQFSSQPEIKKCQWVHRHHPRPSQPSLRVVVKWWVAARSGPEKFDDGEP
ncbi:hypothetical protein EVAR_48806_1 [Eumeta japonica]|uniref:Uncharacterized protein n=1 Tax=Eumeta variegata TaxID=151549 RepID=A0A4C1Y4I3_EUMVA|nr:hypothetical protein EVAR_48806_1 [Eumeta japonica]